MESTVIGVYDDRMQAQNALNELLNAGFTREDVELSAVSDSAGQAASVEPVTPGQSATGGGIGGFFSSLFGLDHRQDADLYNEALRRGSCLLTVHARNDEQHAEIISIMDRFHPIDIDERSAHWRAQGWSNYDSSAPPYSDDDIQRERATYSAAQSQSALSGQSVQRADNPTAGATFTQEELQAGKRGGVRFYPRAADAGVASTAAGSAAATQVPAADTSDEAYRQHWQSNYGHLGGRYEDHALAYQHGAKLGSNERYGGYRWADLEPDARSEWESNPNASPWEKAKDAVRFGWERVTQKFH